MSDATVASRRSIAGCSAAPVWSSSGRPHQRWWLARDWRPCSPPPPGFPHQGRPLVPAWAALSSKQLAALPVIPGVERLVLLVDNDSNQEGQTAAARLTTRWRAAGRLVVSLMPDTPDTDFNDVVITEDGRAEKAAI